MWITPIYVLVLCCSRYIVNDVGNIDQNHTLIRQRRRDSYHQQIISVLLKLFADDTNFVVLSDSILDIDNQADLSINAMLLICLY